MPDQTAYQESTTSNQEAADNDVARTPTLGVLAYRRNKMQKDRRGGCHRARRASLVSHQLRTPKGSGKGTQGGAPGQLARRSSLTRTLTPPLVTRNGRFEFPS